MGRFRERKRQTTIIPYLAHFVNRQSAQTFNLIFPEFSANLQIDFLKIFCYNIFTR
jgi:hypothetical protein